MELQENDYAIVTGVSLRRGETVRLKAYSKIDGYWYCETFDGSAQARSVTENRQGTNR